MRRVLLATFTCALVLTGCGGTLDDAKAVEAALPTPKDYPGYSASGGVTSVLDAPEGAGMGKTVLTGTKLDTACATYKSKGDGWACQDLQGIGIAAYQNSDNVESRVCSFVLAYESSGAAKDAWKAAVAKARKDLPKAKESEDPGYGDDSVTFTMPTGTVVLMRSGSVVANPMSQFDYGYGGDDPLRADPIESWAEAQEKKLNDAL